MFRRIMMFLMVLCFCAAVTAAPAEGQTGFQEIKLTSQLFNGAVVGKAVIPVGWNITVKELMLSNQLSITWPNALYVVASSPDGSVTMAYISRMDYQQQYVYGLGSEARSTDDGYDQSSMRHTLNYRDAANTCDYLVNDLYPETTHTFLSERTVSAAEARALSSYRQEYDSGIRNAFSQVNSSGTTITGTDASIAERTYQSGSRKTVVNAFVAGYEVVSQFGQMSTDTVNWQVNSLFAMQAPAAVFDQYMDIFSVFALNTTTSQEYNAMTIQHSTYLWEYYQKLTAGKNPDPDQLSEDLDKSAKENVGTGDSYSITDGWSDVIREENDYTLSNGSHIKLSTSFDHVYEDGSGIVYAGFGSYYPEGTTELFPTQVSSH